MTVYRGTIALHDLDQLLTFQPLPPPTALQRLDQLQQALSDTRQTAAAVADDGAREGTSLLRSALAAARGTQLELERQLHDARGEAARAHSDAQVSQYKE